MKPIPGSLAIRILGLSALSSLLFVGCQPDPNTLPKLLDPPSAGYFSASEIYQTGYITGAADSTQGIIRSPQLHIEPIPESQHQEFIDGYDSGFRNSPANRRSYFESGYITGYDDAKRGLKPVASRHWKGISEANTPEFAKGYASGWRAVKVPEATLGM